MIRSLVFPLCDKLSQDLSSVWVGAGAASASGVLSTVGTFEVFTGVPVFAVGQPLWAGSRVAVVPMLGQSWWGLSSHRAPVVPPGPARRLRDRGPREGCCRRRCDDVTALAIARAMPDVAEAWGRWQATAETRFQLLFNYLNLSIWLKKKMAVKLLQHVQVNSIIVHPIYSCHLFWAPQ